MRNSNFPSYLYVLSVTAIKEFSLNAHYEVLMCCNDK